MPVTERTPHYEDVPADAASAFTFREFRWPSFPFNWHYHPQVELTLIVRGEGIRFVGDSVEEFSHGDLCLLGGNLPHCWASHKEAPSEVCSWVVQFLPEAWGTAFWNLPEFKAVRDLLELAQRGLVVQGIARTEGGELFSVLQQQPHGSFQRLDTLLEMLHFLSQSSGCKPLASAAYHQQASAEASGKIGRVLGYIHSHLGPELTQREVAKSVHLSPQAFSQFFHRNLGTSYVAYVNELKVRNACRALFETDQSITDIAFSAGFNNLSHFNSQFRRLRHLTPRAFRQQAQAVGDGARTPPLGDVPQPAGERGSDAVIERDVTIHGKGTQFDGVHLGTEDPRPWLKRYAVCPALSRFQMVHAGLAEAPAPYRIVRTNQTSSYFLACFGGRGRVLLDGRWRLIRPGLACLLPTHAYNAFEALPGDTWRFAYVCYQQQPEEPPIISASTPVVKEFEAGLLRLAIEGLTAECRHNPNPTQVNRWLELAHSYVLAFTQPLQQDSPLPALWQRVAARLHKDWTEDALAQEVHTTTEGLRRLCHKELGRSPLEHLGHLRMRRATELLTAPQLDLRAIAQTIGYSNPTSFSRDFKAIIGCRPSEYWRRANRRRTPA